MYKLKLIRGRSYAGYGVKATNAAPFVEVKDKQTADCLVASGHFELIGEFVDEKVDGDTAGGGKLDNTPDNIPAMTWTTAQLQSYAAANGIPLDGTRTKAEILDRIQQAADNAGEGDDGGGGDGEGDDEGGEGSGADFSGNP